MVNHVSGATPVGLAVRGARGLGLEGFLGRWRPLNPAPRITSHRANRRSPQNRPATDNEAGIDNNARVGQRGFRLSGFWLRGRCRGRGRRIVKLCVAPRMRAPSVGGYHGPVAPGVTTDLNLPQGGGNKEENNPKSHARTVTRPGILVKADLK